MTTERSGGHLPPEFTGITLPQYTQIPNAIVDFVLPFLAEAEARVLIYIARRTLGFQKRADAITIEQICNGITTAAGERLDYGTQLKRSSVARAIRGLKELGLIATHQTVKNDGGTGPTVYALHISEQTPAFPVLTEAVLAGGGVPLAAPPSTSSGIGGVPLAAPRGTASGTPGCRQRTPQKKVDQKKVDQKKENPPKPPQGGAAHGRAQRRRDESRPRDYTAGPYGVCPQCLASPCDPDCPRAVQEEVLA